MSTKKTLGAYYQVFKNKKATNFVLQNFRKHFPDSPVTLISDGGEDFQDLATQYNTNFVRLSNIFIRNNDSYYDCERMVEAWRRHKLAVDNAKTDYIMILEDDVFVQTPVEFGDFSFKGAYINAIPTVGVEIIKKNKGWVGQHRYGACGGSVYNSNAFLEIYQDTISFTKKYHDELFYIEPNLAVEARSLAAIDCNLVFHFNRMGFPYEKAEWLAEVSWHKDWKNYPIVHQYREYY